MFVLTPVRQSLPLYPPRHLLLLVLPLHRPSLPTSRRPSRSVRSAYPYGYLLSCTLCLFFLFPEKGCCSLLSYRSRIVSRIDYFDGTFVELSCFIGVLWIYMYSALTFYLAHISHSDTVSLGLQILDERFFCISRYYTLLWCCGRRLYRFGRTCLANCIKFERFHGMKCEVPES